jgi:hypothetical protein
MNITEKSKTEYLTGKWKYIQVLTGWETDHGTAYTEVHFTMPRSFAEASKVDYSEMAVCPHITLINSKGWVFHWYEKSGRKYVDSNRLVKNGKTSLTGEAYPATSAEKLIVAAAKNFVANRTGR